ncbi:MAG: FKBP-type peptidyl-prolyl cis-trans isomerase [Mangrovibacterium sp.]
MFSCQSGCSNSASDVQLTTQADSASYAIGMMIGKQQATGIEQAPGGKDLSKDAMVAAFSSALKGTESKLTEEQAQQVVQTYFTAMQAKVGEANKAEGEKFLAENAKKDSVKTTASGLQYKILKEGKGKKPSLESTVKCHYTGKLLDGTVFDSSVQRGQPAEFPVNGVIKGWTEALQMMPVGSKWELYIPSDLAYGERGAGGDIQPGSTLVFEVELLSIEK